MPWIKQPVQVVLPRHERHVDFGTRRSLLLVMAMPDGERRLEWRPGHSFSARGDKHYASVSLTLVSTEPSSTTGGVFGVDIAEGERFTHAITSRVVRTKIAEFFERDDWRINRNATFAWRAPEDMPTKPARTRKVPDTVAGYAHEAQDYLEAVPDAFVRDPDEAMEMLNQASLWLAKCRHLIEQGPR